MVAISDQQVIEALLAKTEPKLRRRIRTLIDWLRGRNTLKAITTLVQQGRALRSFDQADIEKAAVALSRDVELVFRAAATDVAKVLAEGLDVPIAYDATNPRAVAAMDASELRLVSEFAESTRESMRAVMRDGIARGVNPRVTAVRLRASIGLTPYQIGTAQNYERLLRAGSRDALDREPRDARFDRSLARAAGGEIVDGEFRRVPGRNPAPLTEAQIQRMVAGYYDGLTQQAEETLARTESLAAVHQGAEEMWRQSIQSGDVDPEALECEWHAGKRPRTRDSHAAMNGQIRALGKPFLSGDGYELRYPCDPRAPIKERARCRCLKTTRYRIPAKTAAAA